MYTVLQSFDVIVASEYITHWCNVM